MKTLLVLRHAKSDRQDKSLLDHDRPLAPVGRHDAVAIGRHILRRGFVPDLILCSSARRAAETRALLVGEWPLEPPTEYDRGIYLAGAQAILGRIARVDDSCTTIMAIGHNPDLKQLLLTIGRDTSERLLSRVRHDFPSGALAVVTLPSDRWADLPSAAGRIDHFVTPPDVA